jgi:hypothetical protein
MFLIYSEILTNTQKLIPVKPLYMIFAKHINDTRHTTQNNTVGQKYKQNRVIHFNITLYDHPSSQ